jgi:23S rRNA (adenine2503-C2)-methyltransferase
MGFVRNLSTAEIIRQLVTIKHHIPDQRISNVVFMGMGEPLDNLSNLVDAINILKEPMGLSFSRRKITLSTVGMLGGLKMIGQSEVGLAISLNAADEETRGLIMPINRLYPLRDVIEFARGLNLGRRERVTFEYVMIKSINDSLDDAKRLSVLLSGIRCKINLIPYNESSVIDYKAPDPKAVEEFHAFLLRRHYTAIVRRSRGQDIMGGCGQLGIRYLIERGDK